MCVFFLQNEQMIHPILRVCYTVLWTVNIRIFKSDLSSLLKFFLKKKLFNQVNFWISKSTLQENDYLSRRLKTIEDHWIPLKTIEDHWRPLETIEFVAYIQQLVNWKRVWGCKSEFWLKKNLFISSPLCLWN